MTKARTPTSSECLHCGREFTPRKWGHVYCTIRCRHLGERPPEQRRPADPVSIERLFDPARDVAERVTPDDWFPGGPEAPGFELYLCDTVEGRRRWFLSLQAEGRL